MSLLTTSFQGQDRAKALGIYGSVGGAGGAAGVLFGGLLTSGPGWRWVLTGPESLTQIEQATAIGTAVGHPVRFEELSPETFRQFATQRFPAPVVDDLLRAWAQSVGRPADIAPDLEKIIGRPATTYAQWAAQHAGAFR
ncbi:MAG TPA: hypothetical protein VIY52_11170 [Streptosporangiaceae bacterium]